MRPKTSGKNKNKNKTKKKKQNKQTNKLVKGTAIMRTRQKITS